jgi:putative hydrolase of the HAD superfamily
MPTSPPVKAVIFDLGGVLAEVTGVPTLRAMAGIDSDEELWRRWLTCQWVRAFERGGCTPQEFAAGVVADWELAIAPADFLEQFSGWVNAPYPGAEELVAEVGARCAVGCLSNMNPVHWDTTISHWPLVSRLDHVFLSYRLGMVKPDREIFDHVVDDVGLPASEVLFVDDNKLNVDGAAAAGLQARLARGVAATRTAIYDVLGR